MSNKPEWLPDWRDEDAYTDHGDDLRAWAWEFLRRNSDYQADYSSWAALPDSQKDENGTAGWTPKYNRTFGDWELMIYFQPVGGFPPFENETVGEYEKRTGAIVITKHLHLMQHWGIDDLAAPESDCSPNFLEIGSVPPYEIDFTSSFLDVGPRTQLFGEEYEWLSNRQMTATWPEEIDHAVKCFAFDLRFPINAQIEAAREQLMSLQEQIVSSDLSPDLPKEKRSSKHDGSLLKCLRCFDADLCGAEKTDICQVLYDKRIKQADSDQGRHDEKIRWATAGKRWVERQLSDAKRLVSDGYRDLLKWHYLPEPKPKKAARQKKL